MAKQISGKDSTLQLNFEEQQENIARRQLRSNQGKSLIAGFLFIVGALLLISFVSSLFTGISDQSEVELGPLDVIEGSDIPVDNWAGLFGAKVAHFFLFKTFGISSFLLIPLFFLSAIRLAFKKEIVSIRDFTWQVLFYVVWGSVLIGFFVYQFDLPHSLGGGFGYFLNEKLQQLVGYLSVFVIVFLGAVFTVIFYQLNPNVKVIYF